MKVVTFPIGTRDEKVKIGLTIVPTIANLVGKITSSEHVLALNVLDSYKKNRQKYIPSYLEELKQQNVQFDHLWIDSDKDTYHSLLNQLYKLHVLGFLQESNEYVYRCECGKVEYIGDSVMHRGGRLYEFEDGNNSICKSCQSRCIGKKETSLIFRFPENIQLPNIIPRNKQKEAEDLIHRIEGMKYLVSRNRNTGIEITLGPRTFSIDVDFFWLNILNTIKDTEFITVGSNHVIWHLVMMHALGVACNAEISNTIILIPYIYNRKNVEIESIIDVHSNQLYLAFLAHLSWKKGSTDWNSAILKEIHKISSSQIDNIIKKISLDIYKDNLNEIEKLNQNIVQKLIKFEKGEKLCV